MPPHTPPTWGARSLRSVPPKHGGEGREGAAGRRAGWGVGGGGAKNKKKLVQTANPKIKNQKKTLKNFRISRSFQKISLPSQYQDC